MTYAQAIQFLYGLRLFGAKFGLENTFKLAALAGNPQEKLRFIHVAGTNGKGSTCAMLESIYRAAGLRVGLFTSPHLVSFRERIQVDRELIPESEVVRLVEELQEREGRRVGDPNSSDGDTPSLPSPTFFEFITVMALKFFFEQKCDLVIWETGLGGRLDATNIVTPLASVITNIALDHTQWLGDTLEKIAAEKAGIIKPGIPVVTATESPEALAVIENVAREKKAPLKQINFREGRRAAVPDKYGSPTRQPSQVNLLGAHQKINATLALATVEILQKHIPVTNEKIRDGLANVNWPGRLQLVEQSNGQRILLDGAHNVAGANVLRTALLEFFPRPAKRGKGQGEGSEPDWPSAVAREKAIAIEGITLILGVFQDKDWPHICDLLAPLAERILAVPVASERSADANQLAAACRAANSSAEVIVCGSLTEALERTGLRDRSSHREEFVLITGSLYLVGEALEWLGLSVAGAGERGLNEWTACRKPAISHSEVKS
jgi:dihydrofolate synthase/folylpolyglutamate synthase